MPSHGSAAGETGFTHLHSLVEQEVFCPIRFSGWGNFGLQTLYIQRPLCGENKPRSMAQEQTAPEAELRTGCGSGLFLLDSQPFHLPELPELEKIVLLKQKFIPLPTCLRRMPSIKRTTVWGSLAWVSCSLLTHHMHTHPLTSTLQSTPENPHSE